MPSKSASAAIGPDVCTQVDLDGPTLPMPIPQHPSTAVVLSPLPNYARLDPAPNAYPAVSAVTAWTRMSRPRGLPGARAELLIGYLSSVFPLGPQGSEIHHILAWVLRLHHVAYAGSQGQSVVGTTAVPPPVCVFTNGYIAINATTGAGIVESYSGAD